MDAGSFSLVGVWRLRKAVRDDRRLALAATLASHSDTHVSLDRLAAEIDQIHLRRRQATCAGVMRLDQIQGDLRVEELLRAERQRLALRAEYLAAELRQRQDQMAQAESDWRAIDWLRQRRTCAASD